MPNRSNGELLIHFHATLKIIILYMGYKLLLRFSNDGISNEISMMEFDQKSCDYSAIVLVKLKKKKLTTLD